MVQLVSLKAEESVDDFKEGLTAFPFARSKHAWTKGNNGQSTTGFPTTFLLRVNQQPRRHLATES